VLCDRKFMMLCLLSLAFSIVFFQSFVGLPLDMRAHGLSTADYGVLMALNGALIVLLQPFAGDWIRGRSRPRVLALASLLLGAGFGMNAWIGSMPAYAVAIAVWTLGEILYAPASTSLVADFAPAELRGRYQGTFALAFTSAFAAAPLAGGYVIAHAGAYWLWISCLGIGAAAAIGFPALLRGSR
jgi:MFS family permease